MVRVVCTFDVSEQSATNAKGIDMTHTLVPLSKRTLPCTLCSTLKSVKYECMNCGRLCSTCILGHIHQ